MSEFLCKSKVAVRKELMMTKTSISQFTRLTVVICICFILSISAFPSFFVEDKYCEVLMEKGVMVMGKEIEESLDRKISVKYGDDIIENFSTVENLDEVTISFSPPSIQSVLEIRSDTIQFVNGGCNGRRITRSGKLTYREQDNSLLDNNSVTIVGSWATSYNSGVKRTEPFVFYVSPFSNNDL